MFHHFIYYLDCTEHIVAIELKSITRENYFYIVSGNVYGDNIILYYEKTYDKREPSEERIIEDGKSILIKGNNSFTISTRDQGVLNLFLLAEDSFTHCHSEIIQIPIESIPNSNIDKMNVSFREFDASLVSSDFD